MRSQILIYILLSFTFIIHPAGVAASETDQYNLPPQALADIGDEVSEFVEDNLRSAVAAINSEIAKSASCLEVRAVKIIGCGSILEESKRLAYLRSNDAVAEAFFNLAGEGSLVSTKFGKWIRSHKFRSQPASFKTEYGESIYILNPADYATLSPTIRVFGSEFGIDKLEHIFQQGYRYYTIRNGAAATGSTPDEATKKAIKWGQRTERTYFGLLVSGVYSNADLAANYVGMKFYQGLTKSVRIGENSSMPTVILSRGSWTIDTPRLRENLLKPYLTRHLNEAYNPSAYRLTLVNSIRRSVKKYGCPDWHAAFPGLTRSAMNKISNSLQLWNGENYGYTKKDRIVTIAETCFNQG